MKRLTLLGLALAACGTSNPPPSAAQQQQFFAQFSAVQSLQSTVLHGQSSFAPNAPFAGTVDFSGACPGGGTVDASGTFNGDVAMLSASFDESLTLGNCSANAITVDGAWHWSGDFSTAGENIALDADVNITSPSYTGHVAYDLTVTLTPGHLSVVGSMDIDGNHFDADFQYP